MQLQGQKLQLLQVLQLQIQADPNLSPRDQSGRRRLSRKVWSVLEADKKWPGT